jgi:hypothetical protein
MEAQTQNGNPMSRNATHRRGYALMLVLVFNVFFLMLLGVASRQMASMLRIEAVAAAEHRCDEGSTAALAMALRLLESGLPSDNYQCWTRITTSEGPRDFTVTFTQVGGDPTHWSVRAIHGKNTDILMPDSF